LLNNKNSSRYIGFLLEVSLDTSVQILWHHLLRRKHFICITSGDWQTS